MKSSIVQFVIYIAIFLVLGTVIYIFAFFRPNAARIEELHVSIQAEEAELERAIQRDEWHPQLRLYLTDLEETLSQEDSAYFELSNMWYHNYEHFLPDTFDDGEIRGLIERIANQAGVDGLYIANFPFSQPLSRMTYNDNEYSYLPRGIWLTTVTISFNTDYHGLVAILNGFASENIDNRITRYNLERIEGRLSVNMQLDILTLTPHPDRFNGGYVLYDGVE